MNKYVKRYFVDALGEWLPPFLRNIDYRGPDYISKIRSLFQIADALLLLLMALATASSWAGARVV